MLVSRVQIQNWKNFRTADVKLGWRAFLAGPNASGKSNFLDVFRFLRDVAKPGGGLQKAISDRGGMTKIRCLAARQNPKVELRIELAPAPGGEPEWAYELGVQQEPRGRRDPAIAYERVWHESKQLLDRPNQSDRDDPLRRSQTHLEQINSNQNFRPVAEFFRSASYLHLIPQLVRNPEAFLGPGLPEDPFGRSFLERVMRTPQKTRRGRLHKIQAALKIAVPQFNELSAVKDDAGIGHLEAIYTHWRPDGARQREDQFSDGTLRLIALLWSVLEDEGLLLLEEPELSLNAAIVRRLPALIHRLQRKNSRQILVSTHSAELLDDKGISGDEVLLLQPGKEGSEVRAASSIASIRRLLESGFSPAEAVLPATAPTGAPQLDLFS